MSSLIMRLVVNGVRGWTWLYTWRMSTTLRDRRRAEIESDLWECRGDAAGAPTLGAAALIVLRLLIGIPDDLGWRVEQFALADTLTQQGIALSARVVGAVLFVSALWVIDADAGRRRAASAAEGPTAVFDQKLEGIMTRRRADNPHPTVMRVPFLAAGLVATMGGAMLPPLTAQSAQTAASGLVYEAASVKPNTSGDVRVMLVPQPGGRLTGTNVTAAALIRFAYETPDFQIAGGPNWIMADRFDVVAKADGDPSVAQQRLMLRSLLTERFKLTTHTETRELSIYALTVAGKDGKTKPQLRHTETDCASVQSPAFAGIGPSPSNGPPSCGYFGMAPGTDVRSGRGGFAFRGLTMGAFAKLLVPMVRRTVSDRTGLSGYFDADFDFLAEVGPPPPPPGVTDPFDRTAFLSVFTVLPEQLGLKLESTKGPVDVLVIDRVERPTPD